MSLLNQVLNPVSFPICADLGTSVHAIVIILLRAFTLEVRYEITKKLLQNYLEEALSSVQGIWLVSCNISFFFQVRGGQITINIHLPS